MTDSSHQNPLDMLVTGGTVVTGHGRQEAALGIRDGKIASVGNPESMPAAAEVLEVPGKLVLPGVIDPHVHCRAYSNHIDSLADVARSAAHGGVTTMVVFATGEENETMLNTLERIREEGEAGSVVDFSLHAWIFEDFEYLAEIPKAIEGGVTSFKVMMGYKKRGRGRCIPDEYFYAALDIVGRHGGTVLVHAENGPVIDYLENRAFDAGMDGADFQEYSRPPELEAESVAKSIHLADLAGCPLYIVHLTAELALEEARRGLTAGKDIVVETCPQYLTLTGEAVREMGAPPRWRLRCGRKRTSQLCGRASRKDGSASSGAITPLHPGAEERPALHRGSFRRARHRDPPSGSLQRGRRPGEDFGRAPRAAHEREPARTLGLYPQKGTLQVGSDADLVVIDPKDVRK